MISGLREEQRKEGAAGVEWSGSGHVVTACGSRQRERFQNTHTSCFPRPDLKELKLGLTGMVAPLMEQIHSS